MCREHQLPWCVIAFQLLYVVYLRRLLVRNGPHVRMVSRRVDQGCSAMISHAASLPALTRSTCGLAPMSLKKELEADNGRIAWGEGACRLTNLLSPAAASAAV